jgi:hypothetical protein
MEKKTCMNFTDFKRLLGADPWHRDPETLRARNSGPEFEQAAEQAEVFERKLQGALELPAEPTLIEDLLSIPGPSGGSRRLPGWLALAASVVLVAGSISIVWLQSRPPKDIEQYVLQHYGHDGEILAARAGRQADPRQIEQTLAEFGVEASAQLAAQVRLIKYCPTPDGRGAHMILASADGSPVHLIYMPETGVTDGQQFRFDGMQAQLLQLQAGSAAIIRTSGQPLGGLDELVRGGIAAVESET